LKRIARREEADGQQERQSDRRKLLPATTLPTAFRPRTMSGKPDGELASRGAQKINIKYYKSVIYIKNTVNNIIS
jgi:hypothetical protein